MSRYQTTKKYLVPTLGAAAFFLGGLITRAKTLDSIETLEKRYFSDQVVEEEPPLESGV